MGTLSKDSMARIARFKILLEQCRILEMWLGEPCALKFHTRFKGKPASLEAEEEYQRLTETILN